MVIKIIIVLMVFCVGYTMGQGHYPLDFDGDKTLTSNDLKTALDYLKPRS